MSVRSLIEEKVYTIPQLSPYGSPRKWRRIISAGEIGTIRIGGTTLVPAGELERFLAARYTPPKKMAQVVEPNLIDLTNRLCPSTRKRATG